MEIDWTEFVGRAGSAIDAEIVEEFVRSRRVLITGAGGSIGSALARTLAGAGVDRLILLDIAEHGLFELSGELQSGFGNERRELIAGDVCDRALLREVFEEHRPHVVFHAAACKHVSLMESNPFTAARTNIVGTRRVIEEASAARVGQVVVISTDKAAAPTGIMGATKRVGELLVLASAGPLKVKAVRLANVLGSSGSVAPIFARQIARGGPLTITDPACRRYFLSMEEAVTHLLSALAVEGSATVLVPETGKAFTIPELARFLVERLSRNPEQEEIVYTGLRAGEKLVEDMVARDESLSLSNLPFLRQAMPREAVSWPSLITAIDEIEGAIEERDLDRLLNVVAALVPAYQPSLLLQQLAGHKAKLVS